MRPVRVAIAGVLLAILGLAGCGRPAGDAPETPTPSGSAAGSFPVTVQAGNGQVTIAGRPERIVSLSPTATEILFAIGAGDQVVAVDEQSDYPPEAPRTSLSGFKPNVEAIISYKPDLVVTSTDANGVVDGLTKVGVPVLVEPAANRLDDTYDQIMDLGAATGNGAKAAEVAADIKRRIDELVAKAPKGTGLTYYHELDNTPYSITSNTFLGQIYAMFGLENIADKAPDAAGGYPRLSTEFIAEADPDLIFLADVKCCGESAETLAKRPGWAKLSAIKNKRVFQLDDDIASRWGPRVVEFARAVSEAVQKAAG